MSDEDKVYFEAIGRYHAAMKQARIALTARDWAAGELRELMAQVTATGHAEFRLSGWRLNRCETLMRAVQDAEALLLRDVLMAAEHAAAAGEEPPSVEATADKENKLDDTNNMRIVLAEPVALIAHDPARDVSGGN